jgi:hypothetical protein
LMKAERASANANNKDTPPYGGLGYHKLTIHKVVTKEFTGG